MAKIKSNEVTPIDAWWCETCKSDKMSRNKTLKHLQEKHGLKGTSPKCAIKTLMHLDSKTWYSNKYEVTVKSPTGIIVLTHETLDPRAKDDMMRYA